MLESERRTRITYPDSVEVTIHTGQALPGMRAAIALPTPEGGSIAAELGEAEVNIIDAITVRPSSGTRGFRAAPNEELKIEVPLAPNERAILLLESGGVYSWRYADPPQRGPRARTIAPTATFTLAGPRVARGTRAATRNVVVDWLMEKVRDKLTAYVFKSAVRAGAKAFVYAYEAKVLKEGPIAVTGLDPARWTVDQSPFTMPSPVPKQVLLLIHGTFSTTQGSFGALSGHAAGRALLTLAYGTYGTVVGFDHSTLAEDPAQNAAKIFDAIKNFPDGTIFDLVAFSRGALVARALFEQIVAASGRSLILRRAVFVGCTNAGTNLAEPKNLEDAVDLYTNVVAAGARATALIPGAAAASTFVMTAIRTLGTLVHYLADTAITERSVPGLAAMQPESEIVRRLNTSPEDAKRSERYAVVSSFTADLSSPGFTKALVLYIADRVTDRIFRKQRNDMVVDSKSMSNLGLHAVKEIDDYGETALVYHTIYFAQERLAHKLAQWLQLGRLPDNYQAYAVEIAADMPLRDALAKLNKQKYDAPVLIRRSEALGIYLYVRRVKDFSDAWRPDAEARPVRDVFNLHEGDSPLYRTPDASHSVAGSTLAHDVRTTSWDSPNSNDPRGEVLIGTAGVIGVRLPPVQSIMISRNDTFEFNTVAASRGSTIERGQVVVGVGDDAVATGGGVTASNVVVGARDVDVGDRAVDRTVGCDFAAEIAPYPKLGEPTELVIRISREEIKMAQSEVAKKVAVDFKVGDPITVVVVPRRNCGFVPDDSSAGRRELAVPTAGKPSEARFKLVGSSEGSAEILVEAWQSGVALVALLLEPVFVVERPTLKYTARIGLFASPRTDDRLVLRIYEMRNGGQTRLKFIADSRALALNVDAESEDLGDIKRFVEDQHKALERAIPRTAAEYGKVEGRLRAAGNDLWTRVVPEAVRRELWDKRERIDAIQVISEEPFIPWEIAVMSEVGEAMANDALFLSELGLTRWVTRVPWPGPHLKLGSGTVFYIAPDYCDEAYKLSGTAAEVKLLESLFTGKVERVTARSEDVLRVLRAPPRAPDVFHFICHGETSSDATWNAELLLEGDVNEGEPYEPETLAATQVRTQAKLRGEHGPGPIVFLNACRVGRRGRGLSGVGGFADAFLRPTSERGASVFIGPMWNVNDEIAVRFASKFYEQLLKSDIPLVQAVKSARAAAKALKDPTWLAYSVYGDPFSRRVGEDT
jgi:hypothetical protein